MSSSAAAGAASRRPATRSVQRSTTSPAASRAVSRRRPPSAGHAKRATAARRRRRRFARWSARRAERRAIGRRQRFDLERRRPRALSSARSRRSHVTGTVGAPVAARPARSTCRLRAASSTARVPRAHRRRPGRRGATPRPRPPTPPALDGAQYPLRASTSTPGRLTFDLDLAELAVGDVARGRVAEQVVRAGVGHHLAQVAAPCRWC